MSADILVLPFSVELGSLLQFLKRVFGVPYNVLVAFARPMNAMLAMEHSPSTHDKQNKCQIDDVCTLSLVYKAPHFGVVSTPVPIYISILIGKQIDSSSMQSEYMLPENYSGSDVSGFVRHRVVSGVY